jgi:hypothetical protein
MVKTKNRNIIIIIGIILTFIIINQGGIVGEQAIVKNTLDEIFEHEKCTPGTDIYYCDTDFYQGYCLDSSPVTCEQLFEPDFDMCSLVDSCPDLSCTSPTGNYGQYYCSDVNSAILRCDPLASGFSHGWAEHESCDDCSSFSVSNSPDLCNVETEVFCYRCEDDFGNVDIDRFESCPSGWSEEQLTISDCQVEYTCYTCGSGGSPNTVISTTFIGECPEGWQEQELTTDQCTEGIQTCTSPNAIEDQYYCNDAASAITICDPDNSGFDTGWSEFETCDNCAIFTVQNSPDNLCEGETGVFCYQCTAEMDGTVNIERHDSCPSGWSSDQLTRTDCTESTKCWQCSDSKTVIGQTFLGSTCPTDWQEKEISTKDCTEDFSGKLDKTEECKDTEECKERGLCESNEDATKCVSACTFFEKWDKENQECGLNMAIIFLGVGLLFALKMFQG